MTDMAARLAALSPQQRAEFERRLRERGLATDGAGPAATTRFPLSVTQRGVWFLEQLRPGNPAYRITAALRMRGRLDTEVLHRALNEIVRRHEALRTTFPQQDGRPVQEVHREPTLTLPLTTLAPEAAADADRLEAEIFSALGEPFDLTSGPLLRLHLLRVGAEDHVLALAMHHLISDGWSVGVLVSELSALYAAFRQGRPSPLPPLRIQYGDFATWQHRMLDERDNEADLAYWRQQLAGAPEALGLPTDRPRPPVQGFNGGSVPVELPAEVMSGLADAARRHRATPYMALLAVLHVLLHRYSRQDDVVIGVPAANRTRGELEPLIGFFVNTLPVRADLSGEPTFGRLLERVRDACRGAYARQELPFEKVVEDLRPQRDLSRSPVFQAGLTYQADPLPSLTMGDLDIERVPLRSQGARFDLELQSFADAGRLTGWFEYDRDLFERTTMERFAAHFERLAAQAAADPERPVGRFDLLDAEERRHIVEDTNDTARDWPEPGWIHQRFEEQARLRPDAEALRFEGESLCYGELNRRANRLAHRLIRHGVGRDTLVAVAMDRCPELVVSLLAVVKAGGAYVPIDPGYPAARLEHMLRDSAAPVLLTRRSTLSALPACEAEVLCVEELDAELAAESDANPDVPVDGEDLAYVIYTSGSTGRPKGVMNVHAAIRNRLLWMQDAYRLDVSERVLQKTPFSFDVSVWEFFWPLMTGATLVLARPEGHKDARYLARLIQDEGITTVHFVPSMLQVFLDEPASADCTGLRRVVCSGEALPTALRDRFLAQSEARLHNLYGPTEAAVDVTAWTCGPDDGPGPVPIGRPIANTRVHVLDPGMRPVPVGVPGELHIGGRNLARGYLNQPRLTAERFVDDPLDPAPGSRLYKTGDLARYREDGAIEYLGRLDHQVKIRGLRIELGEIETVLTEHPAVREAVVVARERTPGDVRLVAYVTPTAGAAADGAAPAELAAHARERLPEHMVPSACVALPAFPLTPNGKVDRAALPEPSTDLRTVGTRYVAPGDDLERRLAGIWCDLLGVERVGVHDNVFDLGGHSLLMVEFRGRLEAELDRELSMVELFQYPTVGSLAQHLTRAADADAPALASRERGETRRQNRSRRQQAAARRASARNGR